MLLLTASAQTMVMQPGWLHAGKKDSCAQAAYAAWTLVRIVDICCRHTLQGVWTCESASGWYQR